MLRSFLFGFACLLILGGILSMLGGLPGAWTMSAWGVALLAAVLLERWRYRQHEEFGTGEWQKTTECFVDPETGRLMQVFYRPDTGERRYEPVTNE